MANTKVPIELSSTPGIVDNSNATAITIDGTGAATFSGDVGIGGAPLANNQLLLTDAGTYSQFHMQNSTSGSGASDGFRILMDGVNATITNHETGYMAFETQNTERFRIDSAGNILFGSAGQGYISGNVANTYNSGYNQDDDSWSTWMNYYGYLGGSTRYRDFIVGNGKQGRVATFDGSTGNVGIGTSSPTANLHVLSDVADDTMGLLLEYNSGTPYYGRVRMRGNDMHIMADTTNTGGGLNFYVGTDNYAVTPAGRFDASGNLGIGTVATYNMKTTIAGEGSALTTGSGSYAVASIYDTATPAAGTGGGLAFQGDDGTSSAVTFAVVNGSKENSTVGNYASYLGFFTRAHSAHLTEKMRIDSSGNLLVGVSSQIYNGIQCNQFNGTTHNGIVLKTTRAATGTTFTAFLNSAGTACGSIIQIGTTTVQYGTSSDRRLKENISDSDDSGLVIDAIQVRKFDWIGTDEHERYGFIAQELQEVVPVAVCSMGIPDEEDPMLGVDPSKLVALAIKEIQSLRARIAILEGA